MNKTNDSKKASAPTDKSAQVGRARFCGLPVRGCGRFERPLKGLAYVMILGPITYCAFLAGGWLTALVVLGVMAWSISNSPGG
jgi:hypothetical protein